MTVCTQLSERMPDVMLGRAHWSPGEQRHLAACAGCRAEWEVLAAVTRLGAALSAGEDPSATASRVLQHLRADRARRSSHRRGWAVAAAGLAAAAVVAVWSRPAPRRKLRVWPLNDLGRQRRTDAR